MIAPRPPLYMDPHRKAGQRVALHLRNASSLRRKFHRAAKLRRHMSDEERQAEEKRLQEAIARLIDAKSLTPRTHVQAAGLGPVNDLNGFITGQLADDVPDVAGLEVEVEDDTPPPDEGLEPA